MSASVKFKMIHHVDQKTIDALYADYSPVFVLSTGRSGSKFVEVLLNCAANVMAFHEPGPTLQYFSNYAFHNQDDERILTQMIQAARMESILSVYIKDKIYVESNQCLAFFAPALARLFKKSKFAHLIRHPGDFARSALRKGWHANDSIWESGRVRMKDPGAWESLDQVEKLGWVWMATNQFIESFKSRIEPWRTFTVRLEDLAGNLEPVQRLFRFIGAESIPPEKIEEIQKMGINPFSMSSDEPPNMKKKPDVEEYGKWPSEMKRKVRMWAGKLAAHYGYEI